MNKTFKVVFSKARNAMMVVNEATASVQVKGTKTVVAVAVASLMGVASTSAFATGPAVVIQDDGKYTVAEGIVEPVVVDVKKNDDKSLAVTVQNYDSQNSYGAVTNLSGKNESLVVIAEGSKFESNTAKRAGAALTVFQDGKGSKLDHSITATFNKNTVEGNVKGGGAIAFLSDSLLALDGSATISKSTFTANSAIGGKGGAIYAEGTLVKVIGDEFTLNEAMKGGAIYADKTANLIVDGSKFSDNRAIGNDAKSNGGAIESYASESVQVSNSTFERNHAVRNGGAIAGWIDSDSGKREQTFTVANSTFTENTAGNKGGAISWLQVEDVEKHAQTLVVSDTTFENNVAGQTGGAIHNEGALSLRGEVVFVGNKAGDKLNDIHNTREMNVEGNLTLDGGISGDGKLTFAEGSLLKVKTGTTTISNEVINKGADLTLTFDQGFEGKYQLITGSLDKSFEIVDNAIYNIVEDEAKGTYHVAKKSAEEIVAGTTGINANQARALVAMTSTSEPTANVVFDEVADLVNDSIQSSDAAVRQVAIDAVTAMSPEVAPMVQQIERDVSTQVFNAIGSRFDAHVQPQGQSSGDVVNGSAVWVQGLVNKTELDSTSISEGYDADSNGFAMGLEASINEAAKVGVGFAYTDTEVDGFLRSTDVETRTAFVYGEYKPSNWFINGIASYGWADYDESKFVIGSEHTASYDVETFGLQAMTGLDMQVAGFTMTPEVGMRYFRISQDGYTDSLGTTVSGDDYDILTGVVGLRMGTQWQPCAAAVVKPEFSVAMTYDFVDADNDSVVALANGATYRVEGETLDRFGVEVGAGVTAQVYDNLELNVSYQGGFRGDYQNHTGMINAKYKF